MATITKLLVELARDPELLERFQQNEASAQGVMDEFGLSAGQKRLLRQGNLAKIREAVDYEYESGAAEDVQGLDAPGGVAMVVTWKRPPGPEPTWLGPDPESS